MSDRVAVLNHTGVCVSDADRSVRFYTEVFGFQYWREFEAPDELAAPLLGLAPPLDHYNVYLRLGSFVLELLVFRGATPPHAPAVRREMNELGLTHLSISVPDIPATCAKVLEHGGTVEAALPAIAAQIVHYAVAAEPLVHDAQRPPAAARVQPARQLVGPAGKGVDRRDVGVGQRVAERDDAARRPRRQHIDAADEKPVAGQAPDRHRRCLGEIARRRHVIGLAGIAAGNTEARRYVAGQINADRNVGERREIKLDRVADQHRAGGDHRAAAAPEGHFAGEARRHRRSAVAQPDLRRTDRQRTGAVGVRQPDPRRHR